VSSTHGGHIEARSDLSVIRTGKVLSMNATGTTTTIRFTSHSGRALVAAAKRPAIEPDGEATAQLRPRSCPYWPNFHNPPRGVAQT
jgi:hypothetical protein